MASLEEDLTAACHSLVKNTRLFYTTVTTNWNHNIKVKKYKKTSHATSNVGYQTNVALEGASSPELDLFFVQFIYLFILRTIYLFIVFNYLFCVVIKYFIRVFADKVNSAAIVRAPTFTLNDIYNCTI